MKEHTRYYRGKPILVVLFKKGSSYAYPLSLPEYRQSYFDFFKLAEKYFAVFVVRGAHLYRGEGTFARGYYYSRGKLWSWRRKVPACVVYDKDVEETLSRQGENGWTIVNDPRLARILKHKDPETD
jgi:hypothetical protein